MLDSPAAERKRLQFDDLAQVIQYSETSLRVTLKFHSLQKPYQIEFLCTSERNDFIKMLRQHLAHVVFQADILKSLLAAHCTTYRISAAACCSMLQRVAAYCSVLQRVAACCRLYIPYLYLPYLRR